MQLALEGGALALLNGLGGATVEGGAQLFATGNMRAHAAVSQRHGGRGADVALFVGEPEA